MSAGQQMPPWLQEQIGKMQQSQQNLQSILIKSDKKLLIDELEEKKELSKTKSIVLAKQEERLKASLQEQEQKIQEMLKNPNPPNADKPSS